jgi:hypothetical protein
MRNAAALLELGLCSWALQRAAAAGFTPTTTPDLVRASLLEKCGFQPRGDTTQARARAHPNPKPNPPLPGPAPSERCAGAARARQLVGATGSGA